MRGGDPSQPVKREETRGRGAQTAARGAGLESGDSVGLHPSTPPLSLDRVFEPMIEQLHIRRT